MQPTRGTAAWQQLEGSLVWSIVANIGSGNPFSTPDTTPMWLFVLGLLSIGALVAFFGLVYRTFVLSKALHRGRRQGYPLQVLMAVAADDHGETADLLNRSGRFAMLTVDQQRTLVHGRRARTLVLPATLSITLLLTVVWLLGPTRTTYSVELLPTGYAVLLVLPAVLGVITFSYLMALELRLRGQLPWEASSAFAARAEFVRDWLARASSGFHVRVTPAALALPVLVIALGLATIVGMLMVSGSIMISSRLVRSDEGGRGSAGVTNRYVREEHNLDAAISALAPAVPVVHRDSGAVRLLAIAAFSAAIRGYPTDLQDTAEFLSMRTPHKRALALLNVDTSRIPEVRMEDFGGQLPAHVPIARLAAISRSVWLDAMLRFARSDSGAPPFMYPTPELLRTSEDIFGGAVLWPFANPARARFQLYVRAGQLREARAIAEALARAATRYFGSPLQEEYHLGLGLAQLAVELFRELLHASNDVALAAKVAGAEDILQTMDRRRWAFQDRRNHAGELWATAGNLGENSEVLAAIADRNLRPHERWYLMSSLVSAYCTNAREILFGVSTRRRVFLDSAARLAADISRTPEWHDWLGMRLDGWIGDPVVAGRRLDGSRDPNTLPSIAGFLRLGGLQARMSYCTRMQYRF